MIYVIGHKPHHVKIGFTEDASTFNARLEALQTGYPHELVTYFFGDGQKCDESGLHSLLADVRLNGEWFAWGPKVEGMLSLLKAHGAAKARRIAGECFAPPIFTPRSGSSWHTRAPREIPAAPTTGTKRLLTVAQFAALHPAFSEASLRWHIFKEKENGLRASGAVIRVGRKVLIDEPEMLTWVRSHKTTAPAEVTS